MNQAHVSLEFQISSQNLCKALKNISEHMFRKSGIQMVMSDGADLPDNGPTLILGIRHSENGSVQVDNIYMGL